MQDDAPMKGRHEDRQAQATVTVITTVIIAVAGARGGP